VKKSKKVFIIYVIVMVFAVLLGGCKKDDFSEPIPDFKLENAIKINEDLSIIATLVDSFDEDYYRTDELLQMLSEEVFIFNSRNGEGSLLAEKVEELNGMVNVVIRFAGREAYATYNEAVFFIGTVEAARGSGLRLGKVLTDITNPEKTIDNDALETMKDSYILITNQHREIAPLTVETFGKISYVSEGIEPWHGRNSVRITESKDDLIYIIFK